MMPSVPMPPGGRIADALTLRPAIGARVRMRRNTGIRGVAGRWGTVVAHHSDGVALRVELDGDHELLTCDSTNLDLSLSRSTP